MCKVWIILVKYFLSYRLYKIGTPKPDGRTDRWTQVATLPALTIDDSGKKSFH